MQESNEEIEEWKKCEEKIIKENKNLRKVEILEKLPLNQWDKEELLNLILEYDVYVLIKEKIKNKEEILPIVKFIKEGIYGNYVDIGNEYRKNN